MTTVYVVEFGEYSSRGVSGVYSTMERAREAAGEEGDISAFALDDADDAYTPWSVIMDKDGRVSRFSVRCTWQDASFLERAFGTHRRYAHFIVWARTKEQAIKAANEKRGQTIAMGLWDSPEPKDLDVMYVEGEPA